MKPVRITLRDCIYALSKDYGLRFEPLDGYPETYGFRSQKISMKIYRLPDGQIRMQIIPLDDIIHDEYPDINHLDDLYHALDRWHDHLPRMAQLC